MQECRRDKFEQESFKRNGILYCGGLGLYVCTTFNFVVDVGTIWKVSDLYIVRYLKAFEDLLYST